jgi:hypothetical protein
MACPWKRAVRVAVYRLLRQAFNDKVNSMLDAVFSYFSMMIKLTQAGELQGIAFWAVIYCWVIGWATVLIYWRVRHWPTVWGDLLLHSIRPLGGAEYDLSDQNYIADALYRYQINGITYHGKRIAPWQLSASHNLRGLLSKQLDAITQRDGQVKVYYSPTHPEKSYLLRPGWLSVSIAHAIYVLPTFWYVMRFH